MKPLNKQNVDTVRDAVATMLYSLIQTAKACDELEGATTEEERDECTSTIASNLIAVGEIVHMIESRATRAGALAKGGDNGTQGRSRAYPHRVSRRGES